MEQGNCDDANQLAARAAGGDRDALARLLRRLQDVLYRVCLARLGGEHAARDATQETALRLVRQIAGFRRESSVRTWAIGVAINVCREQARKKRTPAQAATKDDGPAWLDELPSRDPGPAATAAVLESGRRVRQHLRALPTRQSEAVTLRYLEQLSVAETAAAMGCSEGAVKAAVWQGLRTLRTQLRELA